MSQIISLSGIGRISADRREAARAAAAEAVVDTKTGSTCGSSSGPDDMPAHIWDKVKDHPCYSEEAHHYFARMHVAVAPACNIQCHYCNRKYDCSNESRPGVVSEKLTPDDALIKIAHVAAKVPQLSVIGIAGPGDSLANPKKTFATMDMIAEKFPHLKLCISTNGLALPDNIDEIVKRNVDHVTITINMVDPEIGAKIYPWIFYNHDRLHGVEAATVLHQRQMEGLERLTAAGVLVKVNSVLIPGVNDQHLLEVNRWVKERGAFLHNVMPLISDPAHGTHFGLTGQRGPTPEELMEVQEKLAGGAKLMKHCRQCRADAVGLLGEDLGADFTLDKIQNQEAAFDPSVRETYLETVERERLDRRAATQEATAALAQTEASPKKLVAVATKGGGRINQHFGHANEFQIYEVDGAGVRFVSHRRVDQYCQGGFGDEDTLVSVTDVLRGVSAVLVGKIGDCPKKDLAAAGIEATDVYAYEWIESSVAAWYAAAVGQAAQAVA